MSTPLVPNWRVTIPYTVSGRTHKMRFYTGDAVLDSGTYKIPDRTAVSFDWSLGLTSVIGNMANIMSGGDSVGQPSLEELVGGIWQTRAVTAAPTFSPTGAPVLSSQMTLVLRDTNFKQIKVVVLDTGLQPPAHAVSLAGVDTAGAFFVTEFMPTHGDAHSPYTWIVGRSGAYLSTAPFIGYTLALNRRIRRVRGLA